MDIKSFFKKIKLPFASRTSFGLGLDISDSNCKFLALERKSGKIEVTFFDKQSLRKGVVSDGKFLDKEELGRTLSKMQKKAAKSGIKTDSLVATVPESKTFMHVFRFPQGLEGKDLQEAIHKKAERLIPFKPEEVYSDFEVQAEEGNFQEVLFVACPKKIVEDYVAATNSAGFELSVLDIEAASLNRGLIARKWRHGGVLIFDCGARTTTITIFDKVGLRFLDNIGIAGRAFTKAIAEQLDISSEKAAAVKRKRGLTNPKIEKALQPLLDTLSKGVQKSIGQYKEKYGQEVQTVILCGGSALLQGLEELLDQSLESTVKRGQVFKTKDIVVPQKFLEEVLNFLVYAPVLGSALRKIQPESEPPSLNLLPVHH